MTDTEEKKVLREKPAQVKEKPATNDKPIYVMKGLFKDTSFIIQYAEKMAQGQ
ncbi:MAG: hypothetical protein WCG29_13640 [Desulfomonile sp.]|nr:hypothetical protein [Deltaproteobacteria bacterium]